MEGWRVEGHAWVCDFEKYPEGGPANPFGFTHEASPGGRDDVVIALDYYLMEMYGYTAVQDESYSVNGGWDIPAEFFLFAKRVDTQSVIMERRAELSASLTAR